MREAHCLPRGPIRVVVLAAAVTAAATIPARADVIGLPLLLPLPSITQNSRLIYDDPVNDQNDVNLTANPIDYSDASTFGGSAFAEVANVTFRGRVETQNTPPGSYVQAGSFWRDEVYFATTSGLPGTLAFQFTFDYDVAHFPPSGDASFYLAWDNTWANDVDPVNNPYVIFSESTMTANQGSHRFAATMSTNDFDPSLLIASGSYLPFSLGIHGRAFNTTLDWSHTATLTAIHAFDQHGNVLAPDQFNVSFVSGLPVPPTALPEPSALVLLGAAMTIRSLRSRRRTPAI